MKDFIKKIVLLANEAGKTVVRSNVVRRVVSSVIAFSVVLSPLAPEIAVFAADDGQNEEIIETTTSDPVETDVDEAVLPTEITLPDYSEYAIEEPVIVENDDIDVPDPSDDINTTAPPADDTAETTVETSTEETTQTDTTIDATVVEPSDETVPAETEPSETSATDTTVEPTESVTEPTTGTTETQQPVEETVCNIVTATSADEYFRLVSALPEGYQRVIVDTTVDLSSLKCAAGVYYDGTYILVFDDTDTAASAIYFCDTNGYEYAVDGVLGVCGDGDDVIDAQINPDAKVKVAVIDTGSNLANESYSVIGDDVADHNGHGTAMSAYVLNETDDAYIISIKALGDDGRGNMTDVYAAVQLAEELGVDYILMAISIRDNGLYDAFKTLIANTSAQVVAAAGNNGANASRYLPAGIDGVITVGALDENCLLSSYSNYGDCVEYYVKADSTSAATAIALGVIIDGRADMLPDTYPEVHESFEHFLTGRAEDDEFVFITDYPVNSEYISVYEPDAFYVPDLLGSNLTTSTGYNAYLSEENNTTIDGDTLYCVESAKMVPEQSVDQYGRHYNDYGKIDWDDDDDNNITPFTNSPVDSNGEVVSWVRGTQAACAFGPAGELYSYGVDWWKTHDTGNVIPSSVKNNSTQMKQAMYIITHLLVCKAYGDSWPSGISSNFQSLLDSYYNYVLSVRQGKTTIPGVILSDWWCEWYQCCSYAASGEWSDAEQRYIKNTDYQVVTRGNVEVTHLAQFSAKKQISSDDLKNLTNHTYTFGLYTVSGSKVADGSAVISSGYTSGTVDVTWSNVGSAYQVSADKKTLYLPLGVTYELRETTETIGGRALKTPSGMTAGNGYFYYRFTASSFTTPYTFTATNSVDNATFRLTKKITATHADLLKGQTYNFEVYDTSASNTRVATGTAVVPANATGSSSIAVVWANVNESAGYHLYNNDNTTLDLIPGHNYQVRETTMTTVNGSALDTPSGWTKAASYFYQNFIANTTGTALTVTNDVSNVDISLTKASTNPAITNSNSCYSLAGTSYGLYGSQADANANTNRLATFTVGADGKTTTTYTSEYGKTYYLKEITAGKGYTLDTAIYKVDVSSAGVVTITIASGSAPATPSVTKTGTVYYMNLKDAPGNDPLNIRLRKVDKDGNIVHNATLAGAKFRISYYAQDLGASGNNDATPTVVYEYTMTGSSAAITLADLKALTPVGGGDTSYFANIPDTWDRYPYGTIRIQEIQAPAGYMINDQIIRIRLGQTGAARQPIIENVSAYSNKNYWNQLADDTLALTELPEVGYYALTKSLDDTDIRSDLAGFQYELYNTSSQATPVQIATGVSQADGRVLWTYTVQDYYQNTDTTKLLTGTTTYSLELPASEQNASGVQVPISYQVREIKSSIPVTYGNTGIAYTYNVPKTSGVAWSNATDYYYKSVTVSNNDTTREGVVNDYDYAGLNVNKVVPNQNPFDMTKVTFKLYNTNGGTDTLIANGTVDSRGNVTWNRVHSSGYGVTPKSSVNVINYLPLGSYRIEEIWDKDYLDVNTSVSILIEEENTNGWTKSETRTTYTYSYNLTLNTDKEVRALSVENRANVQKFNLTKTVTVAGDASTIQAQLYLVNGNVETLVAEGTCATTGVGTFGFTWTYNGTHVTENGLDTLVLPVGQYRVVELCPTTYYKTTQVPYTYKTPAGYSARTVSGQLQFYKDFTLAKGDFATLSSSIENVRIEGSFDIIKTERSGDGTTKTFTFEVYYRGNGATASSTSTLVERVNITTTNGTGSASLTKLPEGWYEIREANTGSSWTTHWINNATVSGGNKVVRLDSSNRTNATPTVHDSVMENGTELNAVAAYNDVAPEIRTTLVDRSTTDHVAASAKTATLEDTVTYKNVLPGHYVVTGVLMDKKTGSPLLDKSGNQVTASKAFDVPTELDSYGQPKPQSGTVKVTYTLDTTIIKDVTLVAYETLHEASATGTVVAKHEDISDANQTVYIPDLKTTLTDSATGEHISSYAATAKLVDTVSYSNLLPGKTYTLSGELMNKKTGQSLGITATKDFTPTTSSGMVDIEFTIDTTVIKGVTAVAFEKVTYNGTEVAIHTDINDEDQTVEIPEIGTTNIDQATGNQVVGYKTSEIIVDTVKYTNLIPGKEYTVTGELYNKSTGRSLGITATKKFTPTQSNGSVAVEFTVDSTLLAGVTIVAYETVTYKNVKVASHADINDKEQAVYVPEIGTTLIDGTTKEHVSAYDKTAKLVDTVSYKNLVAGKEYTVTGTLMDKKTGKELLDTQGNAYTVSKTFTAAAASGSVDVEFTIDTTVVKDVTVVAFENMYHNNVLIAVHADINDVDQTVYIPDLKTTLKDTVTGEHVAAETTVELVDTVKYSNLLPGKEYTVSGVLVNAKDGKEMKDSNGASITASTTFTPTAVSGSVDITFKFSSGILKGTSVVAFEELKYNNITVATHADISDKDQTVDFPEIHTTLVDTKTKEHIAGQETTIELIDTVAYTNLNPDYEYTMTGTLMDKSTGKGLLDKDGKLVTASKTFKPDAASGTVEIVFTFDGSLLKGDTLVAFENLKYNDKSVATHNDINDVDQTVDIPELKTSFFDLEIGETEDFVRAAQNVTLVDRVYYTNMQPGLEYTVYGSIMVKETNEAFKDADGNAVIVSKTFTPSSATGYVDVEFVVDTTLVAGKTLVAFETLDYNGVTLVIHANIDDEDQTVHVPDVHTTATDNDNKTHTLTYKERVTVVDKVVYDNLIPGKTYVVEGTLYNAETGAVYTDTEGKTYKASVEFTPTSASGSVDVIFKDVLVPYTYTKAVVFEDLYDKNSGVKIATHADISDEEQTFERPVAITSAAVDGQKVVWLENTEVRDLTLVDTVTYKGLEVGSEYRAEATLYKGDGTQLMKDGKPVTASVVFVPTARDGSVDVSITFSTEGLAEGDTVVVFEKIFDVATTAEKTAGTQTTDLLIAKHEDINDKDQTITIHFRPMTGFADTPYVTIGGTLILLALGGIAVMQYVRKRKENAEEQ